MLDLLEHNPFKKKPPTYVRAILYNYHYTLLSNSTTQWWYREKQLEYVSPLAVNSDQLDHFLDYHGLKPLVRSLLHSFFRNTNYYFVVFYQNVLRLFARYHKMFKKYSRLSVIGYVLIFIKLHSILTINLYL